jgi:thiol-disulfide isomerase/thioredoxin
MKYLLFLLCILFFNVGFSQKSIPNSTLTTLEGRSVNIQDEISEDKITVLSFWATWCVPCINELDAISEVYDDWQESANIELIAVSTDDSRTQKRIRPMINGKGWPYKILLDKNQELKRALNISTIPQTYILKGSKIIYIHSGYSPGVEDEIYDVIQKNKN